MPKRKRPDEAPSDSEQYRKPFRPCRIRGPLAEAAEERAEELAQDFTQYVNDALRERLEREGRWPRPAQPD